MKKRILSLLLCLVMAVCILAGCDAKKDADDSELLTVTVFQQADDVTMDQVENNPIFQYWEKMFNLDIEWQFPPQAMGCSCTVATL